VTCCDYIDGTHIDYRIPYWSWRACIVVYAAAASVLLIEFA